MAKKKENPLEKISNEELIKELENRFYVAVPANEIPDYLKVCPFSEEKFDGFKEGYFLDKLFSGNDLKEHLLQITGLGHFVTNEEMFERLKELML